MLLLFSFSTRSNITLFLCWLNFYFYYYYYFVFKNSIYTCVCVVLFIMVAFFLFYIMQFCCVDFICEIWINLNILVFFFFFSCCCFVWLEIIYVCWERERENLKICCESVCVFNFYEGNMMWIMYFLVFLFFFINIKT